MHARHYAVAALFVALVGAACGGQTTVAARDNGAAVTPAAQIVTTTTTTVAPTPSGSAPITTVVVPEAPAAAAPAAAPVTTTPAEPEPASIEVDYQPADGATASATLSGPNGTHSKSLDSGAAIFGELPPGEYSVTVIVDTPSGDPNVGDARQILNGGSLTVAAGDHGVVTCDDTGCSGVLSG